MVIKDSFTVDAPIETVWSFLQDIPRVGHCLPGIETVEEVEPDVYTGLVQVKVGPLGMSFGGTATVVERDAPERMVARVEGEDRLTSSRVTATFTGVLRPIESGTRLTYEVDLALRGRLAQFGFTVVRATAQKITADFAQCLQKAVAA